VKDKDIDMKKRLFAKINIIVLCLVTIVLEVIHITYINDEFQNRMLSKVIQQLFGVAAVVLLMVQARIRLFNKPQGWLYLIPCIIIAVDSFPFWSYFSGNMQIVKEQPLDFILFGVNCLATGLFEECIFRGIIFAVLAGCFSQDKKGFIQTYLVSSFIFGGAHLFNVFAGAGIGATVLQVAYTILTGGLFAFCLIKTKNILCCAFIHALYNFCGLLLSAQGLGTGIVFDMGTVIMMAVISVIVGIYVLYKVFTYSEAEMACLYTKLGVSKQNKEDGQEKPA
jgi:membrane protease YdiL (CAAX protease family)